MTTVAVDAAARPRRSRWPVLLAPLRERNYLLLWAGIATSLVGDNFQVVALPVLVLRLTDRPAVVGAVLTAEAIPRTLLMLLGGVLIDRYGPRRVVVRSCLLAGLLVALLAALTGTSAVAIWHLFALAVALGAASALFVPATSSIIPDLVPAARVRSANALRTLSMNAARFVAPPAAGLLIALSGPASAFAVNAASFFVAASFFWLLRMPVAAPAGERTGRGAAGPRAVFADFREGVRAVRRDPVVWPIFVVVLVWNLGSAGATSVGIPVFAKLALAAGDQGVGLLFGAYGVGALAGALVAGGAPTLPRPGAVFCLGSVGTGLCLAAAGVTTTVWGTAAWLALAGAFLGACPIAGWTLVQTRTPAHVRGRVVALIMLGATGLQPLSLATAGGIADAFGAPALLAVGGVVVLLSGVYGLSHKALREVAGE